MQRTRFSFVFAMLLLSWSSSFSSAIPPVGAEKLIALDCSPSEITLRGQDDVRQLIVTGRYSNGGLRDLTHEVRIEVGDPKIARIDRGQVLPQANGSTKLTLVGPDVSRTVSLRVEAIGEDLPINFTNEIVPILTKLGCNTGGCHGKAEGQNGFKLSLLGFEPEADYNAIVREGRGRRVVSSAPGRSLLIRKPAGQLGHGGGKKLPLDSAEYRLLVRWIGSGSPFGQADDARIASLAVFPTHRSMGQGAQQQLRVVARYSDGSERDVTSRSEYRTNESEILSVDETGLVESTSRTGEGTIMIRYQGLVTIFRATIPQASPLTDYSFPKPANFIDEKVFAKLRALGVPPSELCSDGEYHRRVSLDIIGTLPSADEARKFLEDNAPDKRAKLVDALLQRTEYARFFTLKWSDILRIRGGVRNPPKKGKKKSNLDTPAQRADAFHAWIRDSLQANKPYDRFVREILTAKGMTSGATAPPQILWYLELKTPQGLIDDTAQAFLGTRIQCAQCHHHPFEKWSQQDYWGLATFFAKAQWQQQNKKTKKYSPVRLSEAGRLGQKLDFDPKGSLTDRFGNVYSSPKALDADPLALKPEEDPRAKLAEWMAQPDNPFFAKALVNRYWAHFFGRGIVDPIDDLRVTNPPSNPELLDALARDFIQHKFDLKHLIRTICTSKVYQLSSTPNPRNKSDRQNFSRYYVRRLQAEVLLDAVDRATHHSQKFRAMGGEYFPEGTRAIDLPDAYVSSYFLTVFGKPKRESACECEREANVTLAQRAHMLNSGEVTRKLSTRAATLMKDPQSDTQKVRELYLTFFSRLPTESETKTLVEYLAVKGKDERNRQQAYFDVLWALLNTKEFAMQH